jgi:hypothetical protein
MADISDADAPTGGDGCGCDKAVMGTNIQTRRDQIRPQAGMHACAKDVKRKWWKSGKDGLHKSLPPAPVLRCRPVDAVQQLRGGDGSYPNLLRGAELAFQTGADLRHGVVNGQAAQGALQFDEDRSV